MEQAVWTQDSIVDLLMRSDKAVARAVLALYGRQTEDEKVQSTTRHSNGRGFSAHDAEFMTSIAKALPRYNNHMTPKQLARCRLILPKYRRQLLEIAAEKGAQIQQKVKQAVVEAQRPSDVEQSPIFGRF